MLAPDLPEVAPVQCAAATIGEIVERLGQIYEDRPALVWASPTEELARWDGPALKAEIELLAGYLGEVHAISAGDRVAVCARNHPHVVMLDMAIMSLGAIIVPIDPQLGDNGIEELIALTRPCLVIASDRGAPGEYGRGDVVILADMVAAARRVERGAPTAAALNPDMPAAIICTSGTTARSKGVVLSHRNLAVNAEALVRLHRLNERRVHLCVLPLFHGNAFGLSMVTSLYAGVSLVMADEFSGPGIWAIVRRHRVDIVSLTPSLLRALSLRAVERSSIPTLAYAISAAAPLTVAIAAQFLDRTGVPISQGYGLSECTNFATGSGSGDLIVSPPAPGTSLTVGRAVAGCQVTIALPPEKESASLVGEVLIRGENLMLGYWDDAEATTQAVPRGWLRTGDLGYLVDDAQGAPRLHLVGRLKEIIIRNGENFAPTQIEEQLRIAMPDLDFAVAGFANDSVGEEIGLYIRAPRDGLDRAQLRLALAAMDAKRRPRIALIGRDDIPRTITGKIRRAVLGRSFAAFARTAFGAEIVLRDIDEIGSELQRTGP